MIPGSPPGMKKDAGETACATWGRPFGLPGNFQKSRDRQEAVSSSTGIIRNLRGSLP
jgi:hypothetical protein